MCNPAFLAPLAGAFGACTAAAGATAAATIGTAASVTAGSAFSLANLGTLLSVGASAVSGVMGLVQGQRDAQALHQQAAEEGRIAGIESTRIRGQFRRDIGQQATELAGRGIRLDSPSAIYLAEQAGREMTFAADGAVATRVARIKELSAAARSSRAQGIQRLLRGGFAAGSELLSAAPDLWPGLNA